MTPGPVGDLTRPGRGRENRQETTGTCSRHSRPVNLLQPKDFRMFARPLVDHLRITTALAVAGWTLTIAGVRAASASEKTTGTTYVSPAEARDAG